MDPMPGAAHIDCEVPTVPSFATPSDQYPEWRCPRWTTPRSSPSLTGSRAGSSSTVNESCLASVADRLDRNMDIQCHLLVVVECRSESPVQGVSESHRPYATLLLSLSTLQCTAQRRSLAFPDLVSSGLRMNGEMLPALCDSCH